MRRVVITGMGIVSCLGNSKESVTQSLREGRSGNRFVPEYAEKGFRSQIAGRPEIDFAARSIASNCASWAMRRLMPISP